MIKNLTILLVLISPMTSLSQIVFSVADNHGNHLEGVRVYTTARLDGKFQLTDKVGIATFSHERPEWRLHLGDEVYFLIKKEGYKDFNKLIYILSKHQVINVTLEKNEETFFTGLGRLTHLDSIVSDQISLLFVNRRNGASVGTDGPISHMGAFTVAFSDNYFNIGDTVDIQFASSYKTTKSTKPEYLILKELNEIEIKVNQKKKGISRRKLFKEDWLYLNAGYQYNSFNKSSAPSIGIGCFFFGDPYRKSEKIGIYYKYTFPSKFSVNSTITVLNEHSQQIIDHKLSFHKIGIHWKLPIWHFMLSPGVGYIHNFIEVDQSSFPADFPSSLVETQFDSWGLYLSLGLGLRLSKKWSFEIAYSNNLTNTTFYEAYSVDIFGNVNERGQGTSRQSIWDFSIWYIL